MMSKKKATIVGTIHVNMLVENEIDEDKSIEDIDMENVLIEKFCEEYNLSWDDTIMSVSVDDESTTVKDIVEENAEIEYNNGTEESNCFLCKYCNKCSVDKCNSCDYNNPCNYRRLLNNDSKVGLCTMNDCNIKVTSLSRCRLIKLGEYSNDK